jgi:hypothetical protein
MAGKPTHEELEHLRKCSGTVPANQFGKNVWIMSENRIGLHDKIIIYLI